MFYDNFVRLCKQKHVKPTRAALEAGVARSAVSNWKSNWERGIEVFPTSVNAKALAAYFGCSVDYLLGKPEKPAAESGGPETERERRIAESLRKAETGEDDYTIRLMGYGGKGLYQIKLTPEKYKAVAELLRQLDEERGGK